MSLINSAHAQSTPPAPGSAAAPGAAAPATTATTEVPSSSAGAPPPPPGGTLGTMLPFALMFGVIYFLIIRPQQKKMKEHQDSIGTIKHGDEIITNGGLIGKVTGVNERVLTVEIADGVRVKILKTQVASINLDLSAPQKNGAKGDKSAEPAASRSH